MTVGHAQAEALLKEYFAGRLDRETVRALHAHFKDCEACRSNLRVRKAEIHRTGGNPGRGLDSPELQAKIVHNRNLLIQVLLLMLLAWFIWKFKR
ncbi:MAG TPA: zf-HC2 domain-containing protein [bacterium]|nr:zf-HC2 domain-containing protein [bacterium]